MSITNLTVLTNGSESASSFIETSRVIVEILIGAVSFTMFLTALICYLIGKRKIVKEKIYVLQHADILN